MRAAVASGLEVRETNGIAHVGIDEKSFGKDLALSPAADDQSGTHAQAAFGQSGDVVSAPDQQRARRRIQQPHPRHQIRRTELPKLRGLLPPHPVRLRQPESGTGNVVCLATKFAEEPKKKPFDCCNVLQSKGLLSRDDRS